MLSQQLSPRAICSGLFCPVAVGVQLPADTRAMQMSWRNHLFSGLTWRKDAIVTAERNRKGGGRKDVREEGRKRRRERGRGRERRKGKKRERNKREGRETPALQGGILMI